MKIVNSTDQQHIGADVNDPKVGDIITFGDFQFEIQSIITNGNQVILANPNYQVLLEE